MLETRNLRKIYRLDEVETTAIHSVNLNVNEGEFVAIMGPSGCGKSTLLNILGLLDNPTSGQLIFLGEEMGAYSEKKRALARKQNIGFVFQNFNLIDEMTVYENVELPLLYLKTPAKERKQKVLNALEQMHMIPRSKNFPQQLSGGEQQRVAVARAIISSPKLILADEPTGNLDSRNGDDVMDILSTLHKNGTAIIMVTHSPSYAERSERTIHLFDGNIVTENINQQFHL